MFLSFDRPEGELPSLNEHCFFFHFSIDVKTYHGDSARPVILLGANDQISRTALTGYLRADPSRAVIMEKGQPLPRAVLLAEKEGASIAFRMAKAGTKT